MATLLVFALALFASVAFSSANEFSAVTLIDVGSIRNIYDIDQMTCRVKNVQRNQTYELVNKGLDRSYHSYRTDSYYPFTLEVVNSINFTIKTFANASKGFKVGLYDAGQFLTYKIYENYLFYDFKNCSDHENGKIDFWRNSTYEIHENYLAYDFKNCSDHETGKVDFWRNSTGNFSLSIEKNRVRLTSFSYHYTDIVHNFNLLHGLNLTFVVFNGQNVSSSSFDISAYVYGERYQRFHADQLITYCWNSTGHNDDNNSAAQNSTALTSMIDSQYLILEQMRIDLAYARNYSTSSELTSEYLNEVHDDIKSNYESSKEVHGKIMGAYRLARDEVNLKQRYLRSYVFQQIRSNYFELLRLIELVLSRFN